MFRYAGLIGNDFAAGEGTCVSFWTQGCPHHCPGCHNPETWDFEGGQEIPSDIIDKIDSAIIANGITRNFAVLGGEPLCVKNAPLVYVILYHVHKYFPSIKIYLWTGYTLEELKELWYYDVCIKPILEMVDVLIDGPYIQEERDVTLPLRGSRNQRVLYRGKDF